MRILFLDDDEQRHTYAQKELIGHDVTYVRDALGAIEAMERFPKFDLALLDHDLGGLHYVDSETPNTGYQVVKFIHEEMPKEERPPVILVHSYNPVGAKRMLDSLLDCGVDAGYFPFGPTLFNMVRAINEQHTKALQMETLSRGTFVPEET